MHTNKAALNQQLLFLPASDAVDAHELKTRKNQDRRAFKVADEAGLGRLRERLIGVGYTFARARGRLEHWPRFELTAEHPALRGQVRFVLLGTSFDCSRGRLEVYATRQGLPANFVIEGPYTDPATYTEVGDKLTALIPHH